VIEPDLTFNASSQVLTVSGSIDLYTAIQIRRQLSWPPAVQPAGTLMVSASGAGGALMYYNGASWIPIAAGL
jgi:hypothetical protein